MRKRSIVMTLCLFFVVALYGEDIEKKRTQAAQDRLADKSFLTVGVLPNNTGTVDGYIGALFFYLPKTKRLFSSLRVQSLSYEENQHGIDTSAVSVSNKNFREMRFLAQSDLFHYRLILNGDLTNRFVLGVTPHVGYSYTTMEKTDTFVNAVVSQLFYEKYRYHLVELMAKVAVDLRINGILSLQAYGGGGLFTGTLRTTFITYDSVLPPPADDVADTPFSIFGWSAGADITLDLKAVTLKLGGSYTGAGGGVTLHKGDGSTERLPDFTYFSWTLRAELALNFLKLGGASPALFYSASSYAFTDGNIPLITTIDDSTGSEAPILHHFGMTMRF